MEELPATGIRVMHGAASDRRAGSVLPEPLTSLVGREREIGELWELLDADETRLLTLTGPGGVGKTRLALAVARRASRDDVDGVCFLPLAPISDPGLVLPAIAGAFGMAQGSVPCTAEHIAQALRGRQLLLVLDNFEHLLAEPPIWLVQLLSQCQRLKVLVTSRIALNVSGEQRYVVPPLPITPDGEPGDGDPAAVALFAQRARAVRPDFVVDETNREAILAICQRLDGVPLAIELAAARSSVLTPRELLSRLTDPLVLLSGGQRDAPPRQRTLRGAIAWSHDLLPTKEQRLFRHLSVFEGTFTLAAAERVGAAEGFDVISGISSLVDKSLLHPVVDGGAETRVMMLETVREFGLEQLRAAGEEPAARDRLASWCLDLARMQSPDVLDAATWQWLDLVEPEASHLRSTLAWMKASGRLRELTEMVARLRWFWFLRGRGREGLQWLKDVLALHEAEHGERPVNALVYAGQYGVVLGDPEASVYLAEAAALALAQGDAIYEAEAFFYLAMLDEGAGRYEEARERFLFARELYEALPMPWRIQVVNYHLGVLAYAEGEFDEAVRLLESAARSAAADGNRVISAMSCAYLALIACECGDVSRAVERIRDPLVDLGGVGLADYQVIVSAAGVVAAASAHHALAATLFGAAARTGALRLLPERSVFEQTERAVRRRLGEEEYDRAWEAGRHMPPGAIERELARLTSRPMAQPSVATSKALDGLTPRELEVLRCLADGLTNQQIADTLTISLRTAMNHVANILAKLGVESRTAAASLAIRRGLV